jgi:hypothetical protein
VGLRRDGASRFKIPAASKANDIHLLHLVGMEKPRGHTCRPRSCIAVLCSPAVLSRCPLVRKKRMRWVADQKNLCTMGAVQLAPPQQ